MNQLAIHFNNGMFVVYYRGLTIHHIECLTDDDGWQSVSFKSLPEKLQNEILNQITSDDDE